MTILKLAGLYIWNFLRAFNRMANAVILLRDPRESISSSAGKAQEKGKVWGCVLCKMLGAAFPNHCQNSIDNTVGDQGIIKD